MPDRDPELERGYRRWRSALIGFFLKRTHNRAEAEDLTHETFARLADHESDLHAGYVFQVAANLLRDRARRNHTREDGTGTLSALYGHPTDGIEPERIVAGRDAVAALLRRLEELPERTRSIFILYRIEDVSKQVIATSLGVSVSAVQKHVTRAMAHLMAYERDLR